MMKRLFNAGISAMLAFTLMIPVSAQAANEEVMTADEKYNALVEAGIFDGFEDGLPHLEEEMTRAQAAKIVTLLMGLEENPASSSVYTDLVGAEWAAGFIGAATEAGILNGKGNGVFDPSADVTLEQLATIMVRALDLEVSESAAVDANVSDWAKGYVAAALEAKILSSSDDYMKPATREELVEVSYTAQAFLEISHELSISAAAIDINSLQLAFNKELENISASQVMVKSTDGAVSVSSVVLGEDKKSAIVKHEGLLPSTTYTITYLGKSATITTPDAKLELSPANTSMSIGGQVTFTAKLTFTIGESAVALDDPITWSATSGTISSSGVFTSHTAGSAAITATAGKYSATATVSVFQPQPIYVPPVDTTLPEITEWTMDSVSVGESVYATSSENGTIYLINISIMTPVPALSDLNRWVSESDVLPSGERTALKASAVANVRTTFATNTLESGSYYFYAADAAGNISDSMAGVLISPALPDTTPPILSLISGVGGAETPSSPGIPIYNNAQPIGGCSTENGTIYVVSSSELEASGFLNDNILTLAELISLDGSSYVAIANVTIDIDDSLDDNSYYSVFAVDAAGNVSAEHLILPAHP